MFSPLLRFQLVVLGSVVLLGAGCGKATDPPPSKSALLTAHRWQLSAFASASTMGSTTTTTDAYATLAACQKNNFLQFAADGTYVNDEGPTLCVPGTPQTTPGTWTFASDETELVTQSRGTTPTTHRLTRLTGSELQWVYMTSTPANGSFPAQSTVFTATFEAQ